MSGMELEKDLKTRFAEVFGADGTIHVVRAPGRVNLIGEHTDYNDGFVFPMAIEPEVRVVFRGRDDGKVRLASTAFAGQIVQFSLQEKIEPAEPAWANYSRGVAAELIQAGIPLVGMDALICNTLPVGGGLSSSAALELGTAFALLTVGGQTIDADRLALLCQKAEHEFPKMPSGIMDQMIVVSGKQDHAMLLDCRDLSKRFVPLDGRELRVLIANSMVKHDLTEGAYAERRRQCEQATALLQKSDPQVRALRDVTIEQVQQGASQLGDVIFRRARHVVSENQRTVIAAEALENRQYEQMGQLMLQSHASLRDDYEVSVPELDFLVEEAMNVKGVYGARMTGGGFGGCIVALVQPRAVEHLAGHLHRTYSERFGRQPGIFVTTATAGVSLIE